MNNSLDNATLEILQGSVMTTVVPVIYVLVFIISTPCNLIALCLLMSLRKRITPSVIFSINLCFADLLYSCTLPLQVDYHFRGNDWRYGSVACGISITLFYCNMYCSIITTCAIALERYFGIVHPLRTRHLRSNKKAIVTCVLIWVLVLVLQTPYLLYNFALRVPQLNITTCFDLLPRGVFGGLKGYVYFCSNFVLFNVAPPVVLLHCYCAVAQALGRPLDESVRRSFKRTQRVVAVASLCFIICYLPNIVVMPIHMEYRKKGLSIYDIYKLTLGLNSLNCCFDPFVYYLASREVRQALRKMLGRWDCCLRGEMEETGASNMSELLSVARVTQRDSN